MVYTLELENGCYYVGWSKCFESLGFRLGHHFTGQGAAWTKLHQPCRVISVELGDKNLERDTTLKLASQHTWEKVRGGSLVSGKSEKSSRPVRQFHGSLGKIKAETRLTVDLRS